MFQVPPPTVKGVLVQLVADDWYSGTSTVTGPLTVVEVAPEPCAALEFGVELVLELDPPEDDPPVDAGGGSL